MEKRPSPSVSGREQRPRKAEESAKCLSPWRQGASGPPCKCFEFPKQKGEAKSCRVPPHAKKDKGHPCVVEGRAGARHPPAGLPRIPRDVAQGCSQRGSDYIQGEEMGSAG